MTFISLLYCWTGARLSAFFTGGLCYRDTVIVLHRLTDCGKWEATWKLDQRWVKNNRDPENVVYGSAQKEHDKLVFNDTMFLLVMAVADGALFGFDSLEQLQKFRIPKGKMQKELRYKEEAMERPILRNCTKPGGVSKEPMTKDAFQSIWKSTLSNADYFIQPTIHSIRRGLGKKVDENYTPVQRSQHLTQVDPRVFGQSYVASCSSVNGQAAFLGERLEDYHIRYFQSVDRFREPGLPNVLPAQLHDDLKLDPDVRELQGTLDRLVANQAPDDALQKARGNLANARRKGRSEALRAYQHHWVRDRRDREILSGGELPPVEDASADLIRQLELIIPERARLAVCMSQGRPVFSETKWDAMHDLYSLCTCDFTVLYLPGISPRNERCPVESCEREMNSVAATSSNVSASKLRRSLDACYQM